MLHPSYTDLMQVVNQGVEGEDEKIVSSRYSIVLATAKRARQIVDGAPVLPGVSETAKPLSAAIAELNNGSLKILTEEPQTESETESEMEPEAELEG